MLDQDPGQAAQQLEDWATGLEEKAKKYQDLHTQMASTSVTHTSREGRVTVTVDGNGVPTDIRLEEASRGVEPGTLSTEVMTCMREAQVTLREKVSALVQDTAGDDEAGKNIAAQYARRFPDADGESDERPSDDEYFENRSFLSDEDGRR
ncbi:YbaB/EbfC family nucleoid-associated protein [Rhodococcus sp. NPDC058521]|uniref:YbaB/EbfC family nucleoid-associated protein n=1 Tax=Rhodococcus sp. NPDC058521 TaxID=3346536 RepID=UPI003660332C